MDLVHFLLYNPSITLSELVNQNDVLAVLPTILLNAYWNNMNVSCTSIKVKAKRILHFMLNMFDTY